MNQYRQALLTRRRALGALSATPALRFVPTGEAQSPSSGSDAPSLGNLFLEIESYKRALSPDYSFLNSRFDNLESWKAEARARYETLLLYSPERVTPAARIISRQKRNGYTEEHLSFRTSPFTEIPALLLVPENPLPSRPALAALHDHGGFYFYGKEKLVEVEHEPRVLAEFKQRIYEGTSYASDFARAGFVVLVIDAFYFGQRRLDPQMLPSKARAPLNGLQPESDDFITASNKLAGAYESLTAKTIFLSGATWPGMLVWDDLRSVDYLATRPEVNPDRIGCVGLSLGGLRAAHLCGLHARIRSTVVCCFMSTFESMLRNDVEHHTWMLYAPGAVRVLDLPDVASLTAPNALMVQYGEHDPLFPPKGKHDSAEKLRATFAKARCPEKFKPAFYDAPHMFSKKMQSDALEWFRRTLA